MTSRSGWAVRRGAGTGAALASVRPRQSPGPGPTLQGAGEQQTPDFQRAPSSGGPTVARELEGRVFGDAACVQVVRFPLSPTPSREDAPVTPKRGTRRVAATTSPLPLAAVSGLHIPSKPGRGCCWRPLGAPQCSGRPTQRGLRPSSEACPQGEPAGPQLCSW